MGVTLEVEVGQLEVSRVVDRTRQSRCSSDRVPTGAVARLAGLSVLWATMAAAAEPVAHWRLDERTGAVAYDCSLNANHGTLVSDPIRSMTAAPTGFANPRALNFDGSNHVTVPSSPSIQLTDALTLAAWIFVPSPSTGPFTQGIVSRTQPSTSTSYALRMQGGRANLGLHNGVFNCSLQASTPLQAARWTHVAGSYDGATMRVYVDGQLAATSACATGPLLLSDKPLFIGKELEIEGGRHFSGSIDDVRVYAQVLSAAQIQELFESDSPGPCVRLVAAPVAGPVGVVSRRDEDDCPTVVDECAAPDGPFAQSGWCFDKHSVLNCNGEVATSLGGIGGANDVAAWDVNLEDSDRGMPVYAAQAGYVAATFGGRCNASDTQCSRGQVLVQHTDASGNWWSGYLHLDPILVRAGEEIEPTTLIGYVSDRRDGADPIAPHLHFVVYDGENVMGGLRSVPAIFDERDDLDRDGVWDDVDPCAGIPGANPPDADRNGCEDTPEGLIRFVAHLHLRSGVDEVLTRIASRAKLLHDAGQRQAATVLLAAFRLRVTFYRVSGLLSDGSAHLLRLYAANVIDTL